MFQYITQNFTTEFIDKSYYILHKNKVNHNESIRNCLTTRQKIGLVSHNALPRMIPPWSIE